MSCTDTFIDLVFVLDSSGSINDNTPDGAPVENYDLLLNFVVSIVDELEIGPTATRVGLVLFSDIGEMIFPLDAYSEKSDLIEAILETKYVGGNTNTSGGLLIMQNEAFTTAMGDRANYANVAIVITDGYSTYDNASTIPNAIAAREKGIEIMTVGITDDINLNEVQMMSSAPQLENINYFLSRNFEDLPVVVDTLVDQTCTNTGGKKGYG